MRSYHLSEGESPWGRLRDAGALGPPPPKTPCPALSSPFASLHFPSAHLPLHSLTDTSSLLLPAGFVSVHYSNFKFKNSSYRLVSFLKYNDNLNQLGFLPTPLMDLHDISLISQLFL